MPLEAVAESVLAPLLGLVLELLGYLTGRVVVPVFTFGFFRVEALSREKRRRRTGEWFARQTNQPRVISPDAGALCGFVFWSAIGVCAYFLHGWGRA